jgi:very-short-patch-repair endonuclease
MDRAVAALAARQHGVVARGQLVALGLGARAIEHRVRCGRLHVRHRGVYAVGHPLLSVRGRWMAAVLATKGGVLSHRSAGALWGFVTWNGRPEVTTSRWCRSTERLRRYSSVLAPDERTTRDGIPATTAGRTLLDLAAILPRPRLELALDQAEHLRATDPLPLAALLSRHRGRRGTRALAGLLDGVAAQATRSDLEASFFALVRAAGLPKPTVNLPIRTPARWYEADVAWPHARLIVELDGRAHHHTARAFERDRAKDRALAVAGWRTIRVTPRQLANEASALLADLTHLLGGG